MSIYPLYATHAIAFEPDEHAFLANATLTVKKSPNPLALESLRDFGHQNKKKRKGSNSVLSSNWPSRLKNCLTAVLPTPKPHFTTNKPDQSAT